MKLGVALIILGLAELAYGLDRWRAARKDRS